MLLRVVLRSLTRRPGRKVLAAVAVSLGTGVVLSLLAVASDVGDRIARELRSGGTNIVLSPAGLSVPATLPGGTLSVPLTGALLEERSVQKLLSTFWGNNVVALSPVLEVMAHVPAGDALLVGTHFRTELVSTEPSSRTPMGLLNVSPYLSLAGRLPAERADRVEALVGIALARRLSVSPGSSLETQVTKADGSTTSMGLSVVGTVTTGGEEDERVFLPLEALQAATERRGSVSRVLVSAVLAPEDRLWERAQKLGGNLPAAEFEKYSCRAYPLLVARDLASAIPGSEGRAMLRSSEAEGKIVEGMRWVTVFVAGGVLLASALAVFAALATSIIERRREIALWKSIGASRAQVILPFLAETGATGLLGGVFGIALGGLLAARIGATVFGRPAGVSPLLMGPAIVVALLLALAGAWLPLSFALRLDPAEILKGD